MVDTYIELSGGGGGAGADFIDSVLDTDTIDLTVLARQLTADLKLSATAQGANELKITNTAEADGLLSILPYSDSNTLNFSGTTTLTADLKLSGNSPVASSIKITNSSEADGLLSQFGYLDSNSINFSGTTSLTADLNLSAAAAGAGDFKATNTIEADGLLTVIPEAGAAQTGVISSANWNKFNDGVTAITDGTFPGAGEIGEFSSDQTVYGAHSGATGAFASVLSRTLGPGVWRIDASIGIDPNSANLTGPVEAAISTSATGVGVEDYEKIIDPSVTSVNTYRRAYTVPPKIVSINLTTTYYLILKMDFDSGTPNRTGQILAERIR